MGVKMTEIGKIGGEMGRVADVTICIWMQWTLVISNRASKLILEGYSILKMQRAVSANGAIFYAKTAAHMV